jgi:hypothetical protein
MTVALKLSRQGGYMISERCRLEDFFKEIDGKHQLDAIQLAHQEATEVDRRLLSGNEDDQRYPRYNEYSQSLKDFISYVRYYVKPKVADDSTHRLYSAYLESVSSSPRKH